MNATMTSTSPSGWTRGLRAAACLAALALLAACGGGGGGGVTPPRFESTTVGAVAGIRDNNTGYIWSAQLGEVSGAVPTASELLSMADLGADVISANFSFVSNKLVQAAEKPVGSSDVWVVDFGSQQQGRLSNESPDPIQPFAQWQLLKRPNISRLVLVDQQDGSVVQGTLMWSACTAGTSFLVSTGKCSGTPQYMSRNEAELEAIRFNRIPFIGYNNWRLPTKQELQSLLSLDTSQQFLLPTPFTTLESLNPLNPLEYWTSSSYRFNTLTNPWLVNFSVAADWGGVEDADAGALALVRLVRNLN